MNDSLKADVSPAVVSPSSVEANLTLTQALQTGAPDAQACHLSMIIFEYTNKLLNDRPTYLLLHNGVTSILFGNSLNLARQRLQIKTIPTCECHLQGYSIYVLTNGLVI